MWADVFSDLLTDNQHAHHYYAHRTQKYLILRQTANKTKTRKVEVRSAKWYLKCSSSSLFSSDVTGLHNYIWIQSCTQSSYSLLLYTWGVKLLSAQTRKKINHIKWNPEVGPFYVVVILFIIIFDFYWPLFFHAEVLRKKRFLFHLSLKNRTKYHQWEINVKTILIFV